MVTSTYKIKNTVKNRVETGQCFEKEDKIYMVKYIVFQYLNNTLWALEDTTSKEEVILSEANLLTYRRPFTKCG